MTKFLIAAIWDLDGLILDTERVYDEMFQAYAVEKTGQRIPDEPFRAMRARMFGGKAIDSARLLHEVLGLTTPPENHLRWRETYDLARQFREQTEPLPGAQQVLIRFRDAGIPLAMATSSSRDLLEAKVARHPWLLPMFGANVITAEMVQGGKPDPEIFFKAAEKLGVPREQFGQVLVFEDAPNGVAAAKAAGMSVVAVPHPLLDRSLVADADQVLDSLEEFDPKKWGL